MKTIGLIGGMSWESSLEYYRIINEHVKERLGGLHSAECILYSVDFEKVEKLQHAGKWRQLAELMTSIALKLQETGADGIAICSNTMHKVAEEVRESLKIPLIHIVDATAVEIKREGLKKMALLETRFTMEDEFYRRRLKEKHGINAIIPGETDREKIHRIIYSELCKGIVKQSSKRETVRIIRKLAARGAEGVILGCTEMPLLVKQEDAGIPLFNTTEIHAKAAADFILS
ncbi:MAG: aspartate/glutamate racemase family protein [Candidatus Brockarchaeota archaeon]|nr:aspartate/glutamate racemase family protein [Candidatus Brockarchaeota archaeon]